MKRNSIPILLFLISFWACNSVSSEHSIPQDTHLSKRVQDNAEILQLEEKLELESLLQKYADSSGLELGLYTVDKLKAGQTILDLSIEAASTFKAGKPGLNNGATILLAAQDRQAKVEVNFGMEWDVPVVDANEILQAMIPFLADSKYFEAFELGFSALHKAGKNQNWEIDYPDFQSFKADYDNSPGKIIKFKAKGITRSYNSVPLDIQFSDDLFIELQPADFDKKTYLIFSNYMVEMVNAIIYADQPPFIYARVNSLEPLQLQLLGIQ